MPWKKGRYFDPSKFAKPTPATAEKVLTIYTQYSKPITFNTTHIPKLNVVGDYNYYEPTEANDEYNENKDEMHFAQAPMYVKIEWETMFIPTESDGTAIVFPKTFHGIPVKGIISSLAEATTVNHAIDPTSLVVIKK